MTALTPAERSRRYRARKRDAKAVKPEIEDLRRACLGLVDLIAPIIGPNDLRRKRLNEIYSLLGVPF